MTQFKFKRRYTRLDGSQVYEWTRPSEIGPRVVRIPCDAFWGPKKTLSFSKPGSGMVWVAYD